MWFQFVELSQPESDDEKEAISNPVTSPLSEEEPLLSLEEPTDDPHNELSEESRMDPVMSSPEPHSLSKDVGSLLDPALSIESICQAMGDLPNEDKYDYLNNQVKPPAVLPTRCFHGINRKFNASWIKKYPWLVYTPKLDGVFCGPCSLLLPVAQKKDKGLLVNRPFSVWPKLSTTLSGHSSLYYHRDCIQVQRFYTQQ